MHSEEIGDLSQLRNVILLGYVSDEEVKALMQKCKAFVFPSYYEGFGIPPLEALSAGARIIIARSASLPEIYGNAALYIDAYNTEFISQYGQVSSQEFYAETFAMYFRNPKLLQKFCPKAYALHDEEFKDFK